MSLYIGVYDKHTLVRGDTQHYVQMQLDKQDAESRQAVFALCVIAAFAMGSLVYLYDDLANHAYVRWLFALAALLCIIGMCYYGRSAYHARRAIIMPASKIGGASWTSQ